MRELLWTPWDAPGIDHVILDERRASGLWVGSIGDAVVRARYEVEWDERWHTRAVTISMEDGSELALVADGDGGWEDRPELDGCIDVDVARLVIFNTLPIRRLGLAVGESGAIVAAWIDWPSFAVHRDEQLYTRLAEHVYRFESGDFRSDIVVDVDGLALEYPLVARRLWPDSYPGPGPVPERLSVMTIGAHDVPALRAFYERLGWRSNSPAGDEFAAFPLGGAVLGLYARERHDADVGAPTQVSFAVNVETRDEVDAALVAFERAGGRLLAAAEDRDFGGRTGYAADPEGNVWEVAWLPSTILDERGGLVWPY